MKARTAKTSLSAAQTSLIIGFVAFLLTVPWLGAKYFYTRGEPREALVAQSMLRSGDWLVGSGYGEIVPSKPPLLHWMMSAVAEFSGVLDEFAARFPSALAFTLLLAFWAYFICKRKGIELALLSSMILITCGEWFRSGISARVDTLLTAFICSALLVLYSWEEQKLKGLPLWPILLVCGGVLTKGPVALVLVSTIFFCFLLARGYGLRISCAKTCLFALPAALLGSLWYVAAYLSRGDEFFGRFFYENIARFASMQEDEPHKKNLLYLPLSLIVGTLPWTLPLAAALFWERSRLFTLNFKRVAKLEPFALYCLLCSVGVLVFYSIPSGKRSVYLLPAYPFVCYGITCLLLDLNKRAWQVFQRTGELVCALLAAALVIAALCAMTAAADTIFSALLPEDTLDLFRRAISTLRAQNGYGLGLGLIACALCGYAVFRTSILDSRFSILMRFAAFFVALCLLLNASIFPAFSNALSARQFSSSLAAVADKAPRLYSFGYEFYAISFYLDRTIYRFDAQVKEGDLVLCYERDFEELNRSLPANLSAAKLDRSSSPIEKAGEFVLIALVSKKV